MASVVSGFGRRLLAASVPVTAVAYAWASLETGPSVRVFAGIAALAVPAALPARLAVRVVVAVVTLGGLTLVAAGHERRSGSRRRRPGPARHLRRRAAVRSDDAFRVARARDPHRLRFLPRDRGHRRQQAVPRRSARRRRDRVARHDPAGPEHDRDGGAGAARRALADRDQRPARSPWSRSRCSGQPGHRARRRGAGGGRRAPLRGRARLAELGPVRREPGGAHGRGRVALRLRRHRLPARQDHGAQDQGAAPSPLLARDHARHLRLGSLGRDALRRPRPLGSNRALPTDPLLPAAAASRRRLGEAGGGRARTRRRPRHRREPADGDRPAADERGIRYLSGGVMLAPGGLGDMRRYTVWSYAPDPSPASLVKSPPAYPSSLARYLDVGRTIVPAYGVPGRAAAVSGIFQRRSLPAALGVRADVAARRAGSRPRRGRRTRPRSRSSAGCARPAGSATTSTRRASAGAPPLVDFLERSKLGYCQQFAGTMALMLRYLGIPARVAVGFTSGTWKRRHAGRSPITTRTPGSRPGSPGTAGSRSIRRRDAARLSATYTNASDSADAIRALGTGRFLDAGSFAPTTPRRGVATPRRRRPPASRGG